MWEQSCRGSSPLFRTTSWSRARGGARLGLVLLLGLLAVQILGTLALFLEHRGALVDDAYISFRYASRWAEGQGLTWNDGEQVEGFSNPLWTLFLGILARAGIPPHQAAPLAGGVSALAATLLTLAAGRRRGLGPVALAWVGAGMALDGGLAVWAGSGLETGLAAALLALFLHASAGRGRGFRAGLGLGMVGSALFLSRPEGMLWVAWGAAWLIWGAWVPGRLLLGFLLGLIPAGAYLLFRLEFFGSLLPNTFFAKLEPSGLGFGGAMGSLGFWVLLHAAWLVPVFLSFRRVRRDQDFEDGRSGPPRWKLLLVGFVMLEGLFLLAAGGDWMGRARYLVPVLPAFYLWGAEGLRGHHPAAARRGLSWALGTAVLVHGFLGWWGRDPVPTYTREGRLVGEWLRTAADSGDVVAVTAAGAIPYFARLEALDVLGINDPRVAHRPPRHDGAWAPGHHRYDLEAMLDAQPRWIVWDFGVRVNRHRWRTYESWPRVDRGKLDYRRELFAHPRFTEGYEVDTGAPRETQGAYTVFRKK